MNAINTKIEYLPKNENTNQREEKKHQERTISNPQTLPFVLLPKPTNLVLKTMSNVLRHASHSKKIPNKDFHKDIATEPCNINLKIKEIMKPRTNYI